MAVQGSGNLGWVTTRARLLLLLRKHPGITVTELAGHLGLTGVGVRRHLDALCADGLVERSACVRSGVGRPPTGWRLTAKGMELLPRCYDAFAVQLLEDVRDALGDEGIDVVFRKRADKLAAQYEERLEGATTLEEKVAGLARIRDQSGYVAEWRREGDSLVLTENNCAVHRVAEGFPAVCAMELALFRRLLGSDVEVTRVAHTMSGDSVCTYRIRPRPADQAL